MSRSITGSDNLTVIINNTSGPADDIIGGLGGSVLYQTAVNDTEFVSGVANNVLQSNGTAAPTFVDTIQLKAGTFTNTSAPVAFPVVINSSGVGEALQINSTGIGCSLRINGPTATSFSTILNQPSIAQSNNILFWQNNGAKTTIVGQKANTGDFLVQSDQKIELATASLKLTNYTSAGYLSTDVNGVLVNNASLPPAANLTGGTAGQLVVQSAPDTTAFISPGDTNTILAGNGAGVQPTYKNSPTIKTLTVTNNSTPSARAQQINHTGTDEALRIICSGAGSGCAARFDIDGNQAVNTILQQTSTSQTNLVHFWHGNVASVSTIGQNAFSSAFSINAPVRLELNSPQILLSQFASAGYVKTNGSGYLSIEAAPTISNISGGAAGQLLYQSAPSTTAFLGTGASNTVLTGGTSPSYQNTPTLKGLNIDNTSTPLTTCLVITHTGTGEALYINSQGGAEAIVLNTNSPARQQVLVQNNPSYENKMEFQLEPAGIAKLSSIGQNATSGALAVTSDTRIELNAPQLLLPQLATAGYMLTDSSGYVSIGAGPSLPRYPRITVYDGDGGIDPGTGGTYTHTLLTGCRAVEMWITGGGGGGGSSSGGISGNGGGGAQTAYAYFELPSFTDFDVRTGNGGAGGNVIIASNGYSGQDSFCRKTPLFGPPIFAVIAAGGNGGASSGNGLGNRGSGSSGGRTYYDGGDGDYVTISGTNGGGTSHYSGMAKGPGTRGGGGGGRAYPGSGSGENGWNGGAGIVHIKEYF